MVLRYVYLRNDSIYYSMRKAKPKSHWTVGIKRANIDLFSKLFLYSYYIEHLPFYFLLPKREGRNRDFIFICKVSVLASVIPYYDKQFIVFFKVTTKLAIRK